MIAQGTFPSPTENESERELSPRVGDGFLELDKDLRVSYASPNAVSAYRRLGMTGNLFGEQLGSTGIDHRRVLESLQRGRPVEDEVEAGGAWVVRRFIPVVISGRRTGVIGLLRDVTESRRRDRMLLIKDATIREIHHRVKNNLQAVASLLRLQARRLNNSEARAELEESVRRIAAIALVHETLSEESSEWVVFDTVAQRVVQMIESSLTHPDQRIRFVLTGSAGDIHSDIATPLSIILNELIQNAVEHAFTADGGAVTVELERAERALVVVVRDDGIGLPTEMTQASGGNLGLQIVRTLAEELRGELSFANEDGARIRLQVPLP